MQLDFKNISSFIACNRIHHCAEWSKHFNSIAFAANNNIALYNHTLGLYSIITGHSDRVNALKFIKQNSGILQSDVALISASADKSCRIYKLSPDGKWFTSAILHGHTAGVVAIGVSRGSFIHGDHDWISTSATDGSIRIWKRKSSIGTSQDHVECFQIINTGSKYALALVMGFLPNSFTPFLVTGGSDMSIHVYVLRNEKFEKMVSLQGHSDWIRSIELITFTNTPLNKSFSQNFNDGDLIIATSSQDKYIRLWKVTNLIGDQLESNSNLDIIESINGVEIGTAGMKISTKAHVIQLNNNEKSEKFIFMFHALLMGHEDWVNSVQWQPHTILDGVYHQPMSLVSASADKSLIIWRPDNDSQSWLADARVGQVGGSTLGFYGAMFSPDGTEIVAHGYHGAIQFWRISDNDHWAPFIGISGHQKSVQNLAWDPSGQYLITASLDQSCRLFAEWNRDNHTSWHEIARTQIHGYDLNAVAFTKKNEYICAADEKVLRVFEAPKNFIETMEMITKEIASDEEKSERPLGASLPALGLSNKALFDSVDDSPPTLQAHTAVTNYDLASTFKEPPLETSLLQHTLWPEKEKLYGHGYEVISVAASHDGNYLVSSGKASSVDHAFVLLWSAKTWQQISKMTGHTLTVTAMAFSPNDNFLLTVSRDRGWCLMQKTNEENGLIKNSPNILEPYRLLISNQKAHSRIIWGCSWTFDNSYFATASRDKTVKIWVPDQTKLLPLLIINFEEAVTCCDFSLESSDNIYRLAVGLENGQIQIIHLQVKDNEMIIISKIPYQTDLNHSGTVKSIKWRPRSMLGKFQIASCGEDNVVRIVSVSEK